ncbi:lymphocyte antigen 6G-like [Fundulus heteroclitus]|uniref:lymphocyte antigen 6G-like n=1 Tax=Fundulus heteroclitus TaxID=8078 RepID=UPI00165A8493|nr:lymphocyte antigen 6G-like [Fundulus heteroclitus]
MQLYGALVLFFTFSAACGLKCYLCALADPKSCTGTATCPASFDRCFSQQPEGTNLVTKGCMPSQLCIASITCCEGDLCNSGVPTADGAVPTGPGVILLLISSALITLFI